jgi:canavanine-gamma-lyase
LSSEKKYASWRPRTRAVHAGEEPDPHTGATAPNLVMAATFLVDPATSFSAVDLTADTPYVYSRWSNPTVAQLEAKLAALEGGEAALAFASGMAASSGLFLHLLKPGDHMVVSDVCYAGVSEVVSDKLQGLGIEVTRADLSDLDETRRALRPNTRLLFAETPTNPILRLVDLRALAELAHGAGAELAVDSTFATPIATRPIELGADYVIHSLTKYLGGHGDALGGAVIGRAEPLVGLRRDAVIHLGGVLSPFNAWLILRGMATLPIRMAAHQETALAVARFLEGHPAVRRVIYPGLPSHPQHELARRQMENFSGMLSFQTVADGPELVQKMAKCFQVIQVAVSLGHQRSLVFYLGTDAMQRTSFRLDPEHLERYRAYAGDGIFRMSVGLEDPADICEDLDRALAG